MTKKFIKTLKKPVVLLVEDNLAHIKLTQEAFKYLKLENNIFIVRDGEEALNFLHKTGDYTTVPTPDLILLDLKIPKYSGKEVLNIIKTDPDLASIPVVILTTSTALIDIEDTYKAHANSYITKPVSFQDLIKTFKSLNEFWFTKNTRPPKK